MSSTPIAVCMFDNELVRGGAEEHMLCLLRGLDRGRFRPLLVCPGELLARLRPELPDDVEALPLELRSYRQFRRMRELCDFLRHPGGAAMSLIVLFVPVYLLTTFFTTSGTIATRLDAGLTQSWPLILASGAELLVAGVCAEVVYHTLTKFWYTPKSLEPSPIETSLGNQFLLTTSPFLMVLIVVLLQHPTLVIPMESAGPPEP